MTKKRKPLNNIAIISFADLWAMHQFIERDAVSPAPTAIRQRFKQVRQELYDRTYGFDPWEDLYKTEVVEGTKPEDIDLSQYDPKE